MFSDLETVILVMDNGGKPVSYGSFQIRAKNISCCGEAGEAAGMERLHLQARHISTELLTV
jgi:hypothetical protein